MAARVATCGQVFAQSGKRDLAEVDVRPAIDRAQQFETNSVLRGER